MTTLTPEVLGIYDLGQATTWLATFRNAAGIATDPTTVTFKFRAPDGTETDVAGTKIATGQFTASIVGSQAGMWAARAIGTGLVAAVTEWWFKVKTSSFP